MFFLCMTIKCGGFSSFFDILIFKVQECTLIRISWLPMVYLDSRIFTSLRLSNKLSRHKCHNYLKQSRRLVEFYGISFFSEIMQQKDECELLKIRETRESSHLILHLEP